MADQRFTLEEFKTLFPDKFESREELLRQYESFLCILEHLDRSPVPELSMGRKAEIFRRSWQGQRREWSWAWTWLGFLRRPAATFIIGVVLGGILMLTAMSRRPEPVHPPSMDQPLTIERAGHTQTYRGKVIDELYPQIENPKIVLERAEKSSPRRVLYGTVDDGEIYVVWNL